jgi:hypothetical protein
MAMTRRHALFTALAAGHLLLVACGATGFAPWAGSGPPGDVLRWYGTVTEAGNGYGYFAPVVGMPSRVTFELSDDAGRTWTDALAGGASSPEARLRIGTIALSAGDPELRPRLAASWAATMFGRHPAARQVVVRIEVYELPPMEYCRTGHEPRWELVYEATFRRSAGEEK